MDACRDPVGAISTLVSLGFPRVLTSGGRARAEDGVETIRAMVEAAKGSGLSVMVGSGVRPGNVARLLRETGAQEAHGSCRAEVQSSFDHRPEVCFSYSGTDYLRQETNSELVVALVSAAAEGASPSERG